MPGPLRRPHKDEGSVDELGVARRLGETVEILREPAFRARRAHPVGQCGHGSTVATRADPSHER